MKNELIKFSLLISENKLRNISDAYPNSIFHTPKLNKALDLVKNLKETECKKWKTLINKVKEIFNRAIFQQHQFTISQLSNPSENQIASLIDLYHTGEMRKTEQMCRKLLVKHPFSERVLNLLGGVFQLQGKLNEAIKIFYSIIETKPNCSEVYYNIGNAYFELEEFENALKNYNKSIKLNPTFADAYYNLGNTYFILKDFKKSLKNYNQAIELKPNYSSFHINRAKAFKSLGKFEESIKSFDRGMQIKHAVKKEFNKELDLILEEGFYFALENYKVQFKLKKLEKYNGKLWLGKESLVGRSIVIHSEQGFGDLFQMYRYVKKFIDLGASVILVVQKPLKDLLTNLNEVDKVVVTGEKLPNCDFHIFINFCFLMNFLYAFKTTLETIPTRVPYIHSSIEKVCKWRKKLPSISKPCIGLVWSGSGAGKRFPDIRSLSLSQLTSIFLDDYQYISLQNEARDSDRGALISNPRLIHFGNQLKDFSDTAALIELMDLVITIDTSVAHLAGAMGKPVWILLPFVTCWRWLLEREDSPWYPTARLFRQTVRGEWKDVLSRVKEELKRTTF